MGQYKVITVLIKKEEDTGEELSVMERKWNLIDMKAFNGCNFHKGKPFDPDCNYCQSWKSLAIDSKKMIKKGGIKE